MPIFEYQCSECRTQFEYLVLHSSSAPKCPSCQSQDLEKVISLCSASSEHTRERALRGAKQRNAKIRNEREYEEHQLAHKHSH